MVEKAKRRRADIAGQNGLRIIILAKKVQALECYVQKGELCLTEHELKMLIYCCVGMFMINYQIRMNDRLGRYTRWPGWAISPSCLAALQPMHSL